jgi:hypothetical protein
MFYVGASVLSSHLFWLHRDLHIEMVMAEIRRFARKHKARLLRHDNIEAIQLLDNSELIHMLRRMKPFELV